VASDIAQKEIDEKGSKKKKEELKDQFKKDLNLKEQLRLLIFKDGLCHSNAD